MSLRLWIVVTVLFAGLLGAGRAVGQGEPAPPPAETPPAAAAPAPDTSELRTRAKERFVRGVGLAKSGAWDAALAEFLASRALFATRVALENAAISLRELRRYVEARAMYAELLTQFGANLTPDEHTAVTREIDELGAFIGEIVVESRPPGAVVVIDGEERGVTPLAAPIPVNSGTRSLLVSKSGHQRFEIQVTVAGREQKRYVAALAPLERVGTLVVREAAGRALDVAIDGVIVGKTPWQGALAPGDHSVALRSATELGTAPSSAVVRENQVVTLVLRAEPLDAGLRVEPVPSNGHVFVDGVDVGSGVWQGRLRSGAHHVEIVADAHVPYSRRVTLDSGRVETLRVTLERDLSHPRWRVGFAPHAYAEVLGGPFWAPSFGGGADAACGSAVSDADGNEYSGCSERRRPIGFAAGARGGYAISEQLGLEIFLGYFWLSARQVRPLAAVRDGSSPAFARSLRDSTEVRGPAAALSARYVPFDSPFSGRVWAGVWRGRVDTTNSGSYAMEVDAEDFVVDVAVPERVENVWIPFVGPELSANFRLGRRFSLGVNLAGLLLLSPETPRTGTARRPTTQTGQRIAQLPDQVRQDGSTAQLGDLELPREAALGTSFALLPSLSFRADF